MKGHATRLSSRRTIPPLVLVVDDFVDGRELLVDVLTHAGFRTAEAADGPAAIDRAFALRPDAVLVDLAIPGIDGLEVTRRLKADPRTAATPVIAVTAHALELHAKMAGEAGCDGFVAKPCTPADVLRELRRALAAARRRESSAADAAGVRR